MMKSTIRQSLAWGYYRSGHFLSRLQGKVVILTYHRVLSKKELSEQFVQPGMYVHDDVFEMQMQFLREHFEILPFSELLSLWKSKLWDKRTRYCVITFDDGWLDNYLYAYPILKKYRIPATIFLPTGFIGTKEWFWPDRMGYLLNRDVKARGRQPLDFLWDRYPQLKRAHGDRIEQIDSIIEMCKGLPEEEIRRMIEEMSRELGLDSPPGRLVINWNEVEEMSTSSVSFGSHSTTHKILTKLSKQEIQDELEVSFKALQRQKITTIPVFCYPNGNFNRDIADQVKAAGYQAAVTVQCGFEGESPTNLFELKRIGTHNDISSTVPLFSWHLSGLNRMLT
jgi:peptidoglycan/xylan/chitin deacetylase (PgdA/CDA1 family)